MTSVPSSWLCGVDLDKPQPHHASVRALWEHEWKRKCALNIYPFHWARVSDMEAIINELDAANINDAYDDRWTSTFIPHLLRLEQDAQEAEAKGDYKAAQDLYLRGTTLGMISRFPIIDSPIKRSAWSIQKRLYLRGSSFWVAPVQNIAIPHSHRVDGDGETLQIFLRRPPISAEPMTTKAPVLIVCTGLDGYRTDSPPTMGDYAVEQGLAVIYMEIPGTGDAPGLPSDPDASARQLDTLFGWIQRQGGLDDERVMMWGTSTGGYDALRAAHTHKDRLKLVVAQGASCDLTFSEEWLEKVDNGEYSFSLTRALKTKLGYGTVEEMKKDARNRFSLVKTGVLDMPCTRLLILNGVKDTIFPVEDSIIPAMYGSPKELRLVPDRAHMGEPMAMSFIKQAFRDFAEGVSGGVC